jgi:hypothetical protein
MPRDFFCGAVGLALAALYYRAADELPTSLLSDTVGADGVPKALAVALALVSTLVLIRALALRPAAGARDEATPFEHLRAFGIVALGAAYAAAAPLLGYLPTIAALIAATAIYFGLRPSARLILIAALGAVFLWGIFAKILGVAMPAGAWSSLFA